MNQLEQYRKKAGSHVTAVRLELETHGFVYEKWGSEQRCKAGDWVVDNDGEVYTIDADSFATTYEPVPDAPGRYQKTASVWAERVESDGAIETKEGSTAYKAGDYLVYNEADRTDGYAMSAEKFESMYEPL